MDNTSLPSPWVQDSAGGMVIKLREDVEAIDEITAQGVDYDTAFELILHCFNGLQPGELLSALQERGVDLAPAMKAFEAESIYVNTFGPDVKDPKAELDFLLEYHDEAYLRSIHLGPFIDKVRGS
jgi:hypothetical protein